MSSITPTKLPPGTKFFDLPREVRDLIYHQLWRDNPVLLNSNSRFVDFNVQLRYEGAYYVDLSTSDLTSVRYNCDVASQGDWRFPSGLWACKQLLQEALDQFTTRAEWFWCEDSTEMDQTWLSAQLNASKIQDAVLFLDVFPPVCDSCSGNRHLRDRFGLEDELNEVEEAMAVDREGHGIRRLCIAGYTQAANLEDEREHALLLAQRFWSVGQEAEAEVLELSLWHNDPGMPRLYDVVGEGSDIRATLKTDQPLDILQAIRGRRSSWLHQELAILDCHEV